MEFIYDDGGRSKYFKATHVGDCSIRAIAIGMNKDYKEVYNDLKKLNNGKSCRNGTPKKVDKKYLELNGWTKVNGVMEKGTGIQFHLNDKDLHYFSQLYDTMIIQVSKHLTCIKNGILRDTYDCSRNGERGIYAIWVKYKGEK